jgi:hypothetical protein
MPAASRSQRRRRPNRDSHLGQQPTAVSDAVIENWKPKILSSVAGIPNVEEQAEVMPIGQTIPGE